MRLEADQAVSDELCAERARATFLSGVSIEVRIPSIGGVLRFDLLHIFVRDSANVCKELVVKEGG
jgi:hypothetical protein